MNLISNSKNKFILVIIVIGSILFLSTALFLKREKVYSYVDSPDRFFSYDDLYYGSQVFSDDSESMSDLLYSGIKHPLFLVGANTFAKLEKIVFPAISFEDHYLLIVCLQIFVSIVGTVFLFLIFYEILDIKNNVALLLSLVFMFSNCILISTLLLESFIYSSTLLIMSYYFISKNKYLVSGLLGALVLGTTITNIVIWLIMVLTINKIKNIKEIYKEILFCILFLLIFILLTCIFYNEYFLNIYNNFFIILKENVSKFTTEYSLLNILKNSFYYLFVSSLFYIDITNTNQFGGNAGNAISFIPSSNLIISTVSILLIILLIYFTVQFIKKHKDKNIICCTLILLFNIVLHSCIAFGLYEAFLYTPHFLFAILILMSLSYKYSLKYDKKILTFYILILILELVYNFKSIIDIINIVR